jgi:hypothetical protein
MTRIMRILYAGALVISTSFLVHAGSYRAIINAGDKTDTSAINQNFNSVGNEFSNTVHKTSTETIHGYKTFSDPLTISSNTSIAGSLTVSSNTSIAGTLNMNSNKITNLTNGSASSDAAAFGQIPTAAVQADQEAGTSVTTFVSPGRQQFHPSASKAWVIFQGTGTVTILASYNVTSITDNGTGDYTVNFTTSFSSAFYACAGMSQTDQGGSDGNGNTVLTISRRNTTPAAGSIRVVSQAINGAGDKLDSTRVEVVCFGDQ